MDEYKKNHNGQSWNPEYPNQNTEEQTLSKIMIEQFMEILFEKDKKYLIAKFHKRYIYNIFSKYKKPNFKEIQ